MKNDWVQVVVKIYYRGKMVSFWDFFSFWDLFSLALLPLGVMAPYNVMAHNIALKRCQFLARRHFIIPPSLIQRVHMEPGI